MEKEQKVIFRTKARYSLENVALYIEQKGYPETAEQYVQRMIDFGNSLDLFPEKYPLCRFPKLAKRKLHCAIFEQTYVFIYKIIHGKLIVYNIIHGKALK